MKNWLRAVVGPAALAVLAAGVVVPSGTTAAAPERAAASPRAVTTHRLLPADDPLSAPDAPADVVATAGDEQASISWSAPSSDGGSPITGYMVTASPGGATASTTGGTSTTVTGLTDGTAYTFTVTASNAVGTSVASAQSAAVTPTAAPTVPDAPDSVAVVAGDGEVAVSWNAPTSDGGSPITGYTVTASPGDATVSTTDATNATVCAVAG